MVSITTHEYKVTIGKEILGYISVVGELEYYPSEELVRWGMEHGVDLSAKSCKRLGDFYERIGSVPQR